MKPIPTEVCIEDMRLAVAKIERLLPPDTWRVVGYDLCLLAAYCGMCAKALILLDEVGKYATDSEDPADCLDLKRAIKEVRTFSPETVKLLLEAARP